MVRFPPYVINGVHYGGADIYKKSWMLGSLLLSLKSFLLHYAT